MLCNKDTHESGYSFPTPCLLVQGHGGNCQHRSMCLATMCGCQDVIMDAGLNKVHNEHDRKIEGFYQILRDKINSRMLEGNIAPCERETLDWVMRELDDCEEQVKAIVLGGLQEVKAKLKEINEAFGKKTAQKT